ncbi:MAG: hypothetical protein K9H49_12150 [Bacteroidales bacterium]|nr:hypothetical protein [Bacteroidales bacterium]MCF8391171.1 hypothetical protein [Bacteroidales bacterium]
MQFDNKKRTYRVWLQKFVTLIVIIPFLLTFSFSHYFDKPFWGIDRVFWILFFVLIWASVIVYHRVTKPHFIFYSDRGNKITIRYFPIRPFNQKKHSIEIPKDKFVRYEIEKGKAFDSLVLYQNFKKGVGRYPSIPLSAVSREDLKSLKTSLNQHLKK